MEITPGRISFNPEEEIKHLRTPKVNRSTLSANAMDFVPNPQICLEQQYSFQQQQQPQAPYQQPSYAQQAAANNGYVNQMHPNQHPTQQHLAHQQIMNQQMGMLTGSIQDRLRLAQNTSAAAGSSSSSTAVASGSAAAYQSQMNSQQSYPNQQPTFYANNKQYINDKLNSNPRQRPHQQQHHHHNNQQHHHNQQHQTNLHHYNNQRGGGGGGGYQNRYQHHNNPPQQHNKHVHQQQHNFQKHQQQSAQQQQLAQLQSNQDEIEFANDMENIALDYLQTVIHCLNQNPGQFDSIATRFITMFEGMENNHFVLSNAMEEIFNQSIENPNFRYMGAKLYNLLHVLNMNKDSLFHKLLQLKLDYHKSEVELFMKQNKYDTIRETVLFLAELYMQLRGDDSRIHLIAENIVYFLNQLFCKEDKENIRCICLTLKLAGYDLSSDCTEDMKQIIEQLDAVNVANPGKYPLASNVISLQKNNWGRKISQGSESLGDPETSKPPEPLRLSDEPIFYGPDGREITSEECEFLTNGAAGSTDNDDDDDFLNDLDPEMDEESGRDYLEFLKQQQQASNS